MTGLAPRTFHRPLEVADMTDAEIIARQSKARCRECSRVFDLMDEDDADEWFNGHDCEDE